MNHKLRKIAQKMRNIVNDNVGDEMTFIQFIFYTYSLVAVASGLMVVVSSNPVRGALFLVLTFFAMAGIWLLLSAEFLALILVLVYVGAVMTLFLFVVMMLRVNVVSLRKGFVQYLPLALLAVLLMSGIIIMVIGPEQFGLTIMPEPVATAANVSNITELGNVLYTDYVFPFEVSAVLLLGAIVAAISLTHRKPQGRKTQNPSQQIAVKASERVRLVKMASEKKIKPEAGRAS